MPAFTLAQIDALFDSMNDDEQLLLIDHLAERMRCGDELLDGIRHLAWLLADRDDDVADRLIPQGSLLTEQWKAHATRRDATLEGAIRLRALSDRTAQKMENAA